MSNEKNIEMVESGLKCDNPECDWRDPSVTFENFEGWLNKPCPKCGQNVLTKEDFDNANIVRLAASIVNSISLEDLSQLGERLGAPNAEMTRRILVEVNTHKGIDLNIIGPIADA